MSDVFIAHVDEDADITLELALCLEEAGYTTWCYEVDSLPGPSYLVQTGGAVDQAKAVILVISPHSLNSRQVTKEVVRAHESAKEFIPVRHGITHIEFQSRQPEWREAIGAAASIAIPEDGIASIIPRIVNGLKTLGIHPAPKADAARIRQIRKAFAEVQKGGLVQKAQPPEPTKEPQPEAVTTKPHRAKIKREIGIRKRWKKIVAIAAAVIVLGIVIAIIVGSLKSCPSAPPPSPTPTPSASQTPSPTSVPTSIVVFHDTNLEAAIKGALNKPTSHQLTVAEAAVLKKLDAVDKEITDLTGIEYCVNLESLLLPGNKVQDISPLFSLPKLSVLELKANEITDISAFSSLTNLAYLSLEYNKVIDITPLSSLTNLSTLNLSSNGIGNISALSSLTNLQKLYLDSNQIVDISPLSSLTKLSELSLSRNKIDDISALSSLTKLWQLWVNSNNITDIQPLVANTGLSQGDGVRLMDNPLSATQVDVYIAQLKARGIDVEW